MRETFTSGSTRGEWVAPLAGSPSLLLYRHFPARYNLTPIPAPQTSFLNARSRIQSAIPVKFPHPLSGTRR